MVLNCSVNSRSSGGPRGTSARVSRLPTPTRADASASRSMGIVTCRASRRLTKKTMRSATRPIPTNTHQPRWMRASTYDVGYVNRSAPIRVEPFTIGTAK